MSDEIARALLSGFVSGVAASFVSTFILILALVQGRRTGRGFQLPTWRRVRLPLVGAMFANILVLWWTAIGLALGAAFARAESERPAGGLLSPNLLFTGAILGGVAVLLALVFFVRQRLSWPWWATGATAALAFGWMLPWLAVTRS